MRNYPKEEAWTHTTSLTPPGVPAPSEDLPIANMTYLFSNK
jgi:hypothetical protein